MLSTALEMGICFHTGPILGNMGGTFLSYGQRENGEILFYQDNFHEEFERHVEEGSGDG